MSIATVSDLAVQAAVQDELEWTPDVDAAGIGVVMEVGTVALSGEVDDYSERVAAKRAVLRVHGVTAVVDNITVHPKAKWPVTETDIAKQAERALTRAINVPDTVKAEIEGHNVTLTGQVTWNFQRAATKKAVQYLRGVYTVKNFITLSA